VIERLFDDAVATLRGWNATSPAADANRRATLELLDAGPIAMTRGHRAGHVTASTLVIRDDGRILLCLHGRIGTWMQLGGHCEAGDRSLAAAALREATEESGLAGLVLDPEPIDVDIHPVRCAGIDGTPAGPSAHHDVRYVAWAPAGAVEKVSEESAALGWYAPDALPARLAGGTAQLIAPALSRLPRRHPR
jgi:8-oxo-dGTP pyrophosphatase MutT (NUDIX family)